MATSVARLQPRTRALAALRALSGTRGAAVAGLGLIALGSILLRTQRMDVGFWIDEALSVGIADRPLLDIPGTLRLDGSPPLYYMLLHVWMAVFGRSEPATHALSLTFAVATIPVAFTLVRALYGERAGWIAAALAATNPFVTAYAQETRMYSLVVLLGTVACATFVGAFALRRGRAWTAGFAVSLAAMLYTHNWALFFAVACGVAWLVLCRHSRDRTLLREGILGFGGALLLYAPWIPSLLFQAAHTGAPWAKSPTVVQFLQVPVILLKESPAAVLTVAGGAGLAAVIRGRDRGLGRGTVALVGIAIGTVAIAWLLSQASPAWATRYLAVAVPPLLMIAAVGLSRAGVPGLVALLIVLGVWIGHAGPTLKSTVRWVARTVDPSLAPGDLVISTQPEQLPALAYYLETPGLRWATLTGPVTDLGVTDWRDGVERLQATSPERDLAPLLDTVAPGQRVVIVEPEIFDVERWSAPWTRLVRLRSDDWMQAMKQDERFRVVAVRPMDSVPPRPNPVRATVFVRDSMR